MKLIRRAKCPVLLLGLQASRPENSEAVRHLLYRTHMPVVGTYQAAGVIDVNHFAVSPAASACSTTSRPISCCRRPTRGERRL